jgi:hypothetical protein
MAECYAANYPKLRCSDVRAFEELSSAPDTTNKGPWHRWVITEAARRTLFMLNMANWFSCYDLTTNTQSPYYEPLCDDIVFGLPLPCSDAQWLAGNEMDWRAAVQSEELRHFNGAETGADGVHARRSEYTLSDALKINPVSAFDRHASIGQTRVDAQLGPKPGFANSEQLRNLIILAARYQRPQTNS